MSTYYVVSVSLILCALYYLVILLFPETYKKTSAKTYINKLIIISFLIYSTLLIVLYHLRKVSILSKQIDVKVALIIIPSVVVFLFVINIFCPAFCIMLKQNKKELGLATQLNRLIFQYKYQSGERNVALKKLEEFQEKNAVFLRECGIELYIPELIKQSTNAVHLAPEKLVNIIEDYSIQLVKQTSDYTPNPFTNSSIVFSFGISTLFTLLLSYISIMP